MPSRTARLSKKGCGFATPECRAQRDVAVHPRPAPPPPLPAAPRLPTTALGYLEIRWVVTGQRIQVNKTTKERPGWSLVDVMLWLRLAIVARFCSMTAPVQCTKLSSERHKGRANQAR